MVATVPARGRGSRRRGGSCDPRHADRSTTRVAPDDGGPAHHDRSPLFVVRGEPGRTCRACSTRSSTRRRGCSRAAATPSVARHRERGRLLARERIDLLLDRDSPFLELSALAGWGTDDPVGRRPRDRHRPGRGHRVPDLGQRPDRAGRHVVAGVDHQDPAVARDRRPQPAARHQPHRVGRRRPPQAGRDLRAGWRHVQEPDPPVGRGHPDHHRRVRLLDRRRRLRARA